MWDMGGAILGSSHSNPGPPGQRDGPPRCLTLSGVVVTTQGANREAL